MEDNGKTLEEQVNYMIDKQVYDMVRHGIHADTILVFNNAFRAYAHVIHRMKRDNAKPEDAREAIVSLLSNIVTDFTVQMIAKPKLDAAREFAAEIVKDMIPTITAGIQANFVKFGPQPKPILDS